MKYIHTYTHAYTHTHTHTYIHTHIHTYRDAHRKQVKEGKTTHFLDVRRSNGVKYRICMYERLAVIENRSKNYADSMLLSKKVMLKDF